MGLFDRFRRKPELPAPSDRDPVELMEQLKLLAEQSRSTGLLFEAQKINLQYWIWIVFQHIDEVAIDAFPEDERTKKATRVIEYRVAASKKTADLDKRLPYLDGWVKTLLGDDVTLRVKFNGTLVFERGPKK